MTGDKDTGLVRQRESALFTPDLQPRRVPLGRQQRQNRLRGLRIRPCRPNPGIHVHMFLIGSTLFDGQPCLLHLRG